MTQFDHADTAPSAGRAAILLYGTLLAGGVGLFLGINAGGANLQAPEPAESSTAAVSSPGDVLVRVLIALAAVLVVGRLLGRLLGYVGQPPVIGEAVAGIALGPSLLGAVWPQAAAFILPPAVAPYLGVISQLGVILYMFLVGLELNLPALRQHARATAGIAHASIVVPFLMGAGLALLLYPRLSSRDVSFTSFALFVGVALSVTAFPVLARILTDSRMQTTPLGVLALGCAAIGDVTAWCLLAFVVGIAQAQVDSALVVLILTAAYLGFMVLAARPAAAWLCARLDRRPLTHGGLAFILTALILSALATEAIGIHAIFGAFLFGAILPHDSAIAQALTRRLEDLVTVLLLPAFFAFTGMRTQIGLVAGLEQWLICGLIVLAATAGKLGGTVLAARIAGLGWHAAAGLGILMNTRGLMELLVLNIGLELRIISPALYAMMVLMALATTMATAPALRLLTRLRPSLAMEQNAPRD